MEILLTTVLHLPHHHIFYHVPVNLMMVVIQDLGHIHPHLQVANHLGQATN
uniref:Uncharacterized protein n=1 Tax=Rhizophora mucronata TaxID=61149 RepID=A0A2P2QRF0_RHIMU